MAFCPAPRHDAPLIKGLSTSVDCHVQALTHDGYAALFGQNLLSSPVLTAVLTLWVAGLGWAMLSGRSRLHLRDAPMTALKVGLVLAFATSWGAYQTVVLDLAFRGPDELGARLRQALLGPRSVYGRDVLDGLQFTFDTLVHSAAALAEKAGKDAKIMSGGPEMGAWGLWLSAGVLLVSSLGVLLLAKVALALLLALGPAFLLALLFEPTRGFAVGWIRAVFALSFAPLALTTFLTFLFALLEPLLVQVATGVRLGEFDLQPILAITALVVIFSGAFVFALKLGADLAAGFTLPGPGRAPVHEGAAARSATPATANTTGAAARPAHAALGRAEAVAGAAVALQQHRGRESAGDGRRLAVSVGGGGLANAATGAAVRNAPAYRRLGEASGSHRFQRRPA